MSALKLWRKRKKTGTTWHWVHSLDAAYAADKIYYILADIRAQRWRAARGAQHFRGHLKPIAGIKVTRDKNRIFKIWNHSSLPVTINHGSACHKERKGKRIILSATSCVWLRYSLHQGHLFIYSPCGVKKRKQRFFFKHHVSDRLGEKKASLRLLGGTSHRKRSHSIRPRHLAPVFFHHFPWQTKHP